MARGKCDQTLKNSECTAVTSKVRITADCHALIAIFSLSQAVEREFWFIKLNRYIISTGLTGTREYPRIESHH